MVNHVSSKCAKQTCVLIFVHYEGNINEDQVAFHKDCESIWFRIMLITGAGSSYFLTRNFRFPVHTLFFQSAYILAGMILVIVL